MKRKNLLVTMMLAPACLMAQSVDSLGRLLNLDEVVVISTRLGRQITQTGTTVKGSELRTMNMGQNLPFLLQRTPSLVVTSDDGLGVGYADFRVRGTASSRINMTINGVPLNDAESQGVFWVNMTDMAASMNSVDVQRGVGTSTNGAAAFGASVNMSMGEANPRPYAELTLNGGSYNTFRESVKAGTGILRHRFSLDARYSKVNSDGYVENATSDLHSYFLSASWYGQQSMLKLLVFGGSERTGIAWDGIDPITWRDAPRTNYSGYYTDADGDYKHWGNHTDNYKQQHYQLHFSHQFDNRWSMSAALHHTHGEGYTEQAKNGKLTEYGLLTYWTPSEAKPDSLIEVKKSYLIRRKYLQSDFTGLVASVNYQAPAVTASAGGAVSYHDGQHYGTIIRMIDPNFPDTMSFDGNYYHNYADKLDANVYAKAEWRPVSGLKAYGDLQYRFIDYRISGILDDEKLTDADIKHQYHFFNPKVGVNYSRRGHETYLTFAVANREPVRKNFTEAGPNETPTSERLHDTELGYRYSHRIFHVGANLYWMQYDNQLVTSGKISSTGSNLTVNVKDSYRMGVELMGGVQISRNLRWDANLTLSRNKIVDHEDWVDNYTTYNQELVRYGTVDIAMSPSVTLGSTVSYHIAGFTAELQTNYVGSQYLDNTENAAAKLPAYIVNNLRLAYNIRLHRRAVKSVELSLALNNLLNEKYVSNGWVYSYFDGTETEFTPANQKYDNGNIGYMSQAPFNLHGGVTVRF